MGCMYASGPDFAAPAFSASEEEIMRSFLTLICLVAWHVASPGSSSQSTTTDGGWSSASNVGPPNTTDYNDMYAVLTAAGHPAGRRHP
jgi:hypothetical protein